MPRERFDALASTDHATVGSRLFQDEHPVPDAPHPSHEEDETHQPHARETLESLHRLIGDDTRDEGADAGEEDVQQQRGDGDVFTHPDDGIFVRLLDEIDDAGHVSRMARAAVGASGCDVTTGGIIQLEL